VILASNRLSPEAACAMINTHQFQPPARSGPSLRIRPRVRFGEPLGFSGCHGRESDGHLLRAVTDEIMQAIAKLSGQEYAGIGARQAKTALAHGDGPGGDLE
jgi:1-acyl-sn-glycerol-3-phosphate acyltransferase